VRSRRRREVGDTPDRWGPPVGEGNRGRGRGREVGCGFAGSEEKMGRRVANVPRGKKERGEGGPRLERREMKRV
jgi:hypothetical protein